MQHSCVGYKTADTADRSYRADQRPLFIVDNRRHHKRFPQSQPLCPHVPADCAGFGITAAALTGCGVSLDPPSAQTITFTQNPPARAPYNSQFTVAASATSGLAVTFFTSSGACTATREPPTPWLAALASARSCRARPAMPPVRGGPDHSDRSRDSRPADHHLHRQPSSQRSLRQPVHRDGQRIPPVWR